MNTTAAPNRLAELREAASLTQREVADRLGPPVTPGQVSRWERGDHTPLPRYRRRLAEVYNVPVSALEIPTTPSAPIPRPRLSAEDYMADEVQDPRVQASQDEWRRTRQLLNESRHRLSQVAAGLYPEHEMPGTGLIAGRGWIPDGPVDLADVTIVEDTAAVEPLLTGAEREAARMLPDQTLTRAFPRYTTAVRDLARPRLFEDRASWRLTGLDWAGGRGRMGFADTSYFAAMDVCEPAAHELAYVALDADGELAAHPSMRDLPYRRLIRDPFAFERRPILPAISTLTIRRDGDRAEFLLHRRDPRAVAAAGGMLQVIPSGIFQPSSMMPAGRAADFDLWRNIGREFSEELLGAAECDGHGRPVDYTAAPFAQLDEARADGRLRVACLGVALDALTLIGEILTILVIDADTFDDLAADFVDRNDEGSVEDERFPFTEQGVRGLLDAGRIAPAGAGCLELAWRWRDQLL